MSTCNQLNLQALDLDRLCPKMTPITGPMSPPKSCSVVTDPQVEVICDQALNPLLFNESMYADPHT